MKKIIPLVLAVLLMTAAGVGGYVYYKANRGFTPWMTEEQMDSFCKEREEKGADQKNYWSHGHWLTGVQGRWHHGAPQYGVRVADAPAKPYWWYWWYNQSADAFRGHIHTMADQGITLIYTDSFAWPDGTLRYSGIWHRTGSAPQENKKTATTLDASDGEAFLDHAEQAIEEAKVAVVAAKEAKDLDALVAELADLKDKARAGSSDAKRQSLSNRLQEAEFFVDRWQEYLAALDAGNVQRAGQYLRNIANNDSSFMPFPRSELFATAEEEEKRGNNRGQNEDWALSGKSLEDLSSMIAQLNELQEHGNNREIMETLSVLQNLSQAYDSYKLQRYENALQAIQNSRPAGKADAVIDPLRLDLLMKITRALLPVPDAPDPAPGEKPAEYLLRLAQEYQKAARWKDLAGTLDAYHQVTFSYGNSPAWLQQDLNGLHSFIAGRQQEQAGLIADAIRSYREAITSTGTYFPAAVAGKSLKALREKFPKVYEKVMEEGHASSPIIGTGFNAGLISPPVDEIVPTGPR